MRDVLSFLPPDLGAMPKDFQYREIVKGEQMQIEQIVKLLASNTRDAGMDWIQVRLNGGPPCFQLMPDGYLCGRAQRWEGHPEMHEYVSLRDLLAALLADRESLQQKIREQAEALKQCGGAIATFKQKRGNHPGEHVFSEEIQFCLLCDQSYVEAEPALDAVLALPLVREAMTQHEKVATDPK